MKILVFYDIIENKTRNKIIRYLFNLGFQRIQFSVFLGDISKKKFKNLSLNINKIIDSKKDSVYIFNLCEKDFNKCVFLGKIINKEFFNSSFLIF